MDDVLSWAQVVASVGIAGLTVALVWATIRYTKATERMAAATEPRPYVHLFMRSEGATVGLRNIGNRVAHEVSVEINKDHFEESTPFFGQSPLFRRPIPSIPPGGDAKDSFMLGVITPASVAEMDVTIRYADADGRTYSERVAISAASYADWFHNRPLAGWSRDQLDPKI